MNDIYILSTLFFVVATIYSIAGFGGGSSYIALLILFSVNYTVAPTIALSCNLIVVTVGTIRFIRNKNVLWRLILPFISSSILFSYIGGLQSISKFSFQLILALCLFAASLKMLLFKKSAVDLKYNTSPPILGSLFIGAVLGFVSGLVGIGGGIFLAPILYMLRWGSPKNIASSASVFIFVNSIAGLIGHYHKFNGFIDYKPFLPLLIAVGLGGFIGNHLTLKKISPRQIELVTAILVLIVSVRIFWNLL
ncbi:sulfite exporter TauE/SafE family protein [Halobacteriovorax sp. HLS]|uniref:sulfite exporter TauE/SafE family protein n=1 Tax=Halobacteriovorax sp. HLS TaxID=2234000 RepID=UPI000FD9FE68|nr:sulfite exporter TauE/SafE family protein [Halobacteriovorax sp. HLS]